MQETCAVLPRPPLLAQLRAAPPASCLAPLGAALPQSWTLTTVLPRPPCTTLSRWSRSCRWVRAVRGWGGR